MHSGRTLGWSGRLDWPVPSPGGIPEQSTGRHRRGESAAVWTPVPSQRRAEPNPPPIDPLSDTAEVGGLHKFDLGMVPASVTPPPTWRRAAWFAIGSSVAALGGLMFVTALFASSGSKLEGLELPNLPRRTDNYPPLPDPYFLTGDPVRPHVSSSYASPSEDPPRTAPEMVLSAPSSSETPGGARTRPPSGVASPQPSTPTSTTPPPTDEAPALLRLTDTEGMKRTSQRYYEAITAGDLPGAYRMTGGELHEEGYGAFAARYSQAAKVEVLHVYVSATNTVHDLRLTLPNGAQRVERHVLRYDRSGEQPVIISDERA